MLAARAGRASKIEGQVDGWYFLDRKTDRVRTAENNKCGDNGNVRSGVTGKCGMQ